MRQGALRAAQPALPLLLTVSVRFPCCLQGVGDTVDRVPLGAWYGKGKRTGGVTAGMVGVVGVAKGALVISG